MKTKLLVFSILVASITDATIIKAQVPYSSSDTYEMAAGDLRSAPPRQYNFSKAVMSDVMRLMAEDAGISFFGLPDGGEGTERMVTFTINAAPFTALETLAKANGVSLIHENGIWYIRPANDRELIGRIYEINYNAQELVRKNGQGGGAQAGSGGGGQSGSGGASGGINLQGAPDFFEVEPSRLLEDIKGILDIETTGAYANIAATTSVDTMGQLSLRSFQNQPGISAPVGGNGGDNADSQAKVIWNSDSNTLYVVASRQQHQWIEAYLASADREQTMIAVEIKFLETSRDPNLDLGIDWTGALGEQGIGAGLSGANGPINLASVGAYSLPTAVLSYNDLNVRLRSIYSDSSTKSVSYPRMVTLDNREVTFRSVVNQPVLSSTASASLGAGATQTSAIEYLPIGTVINVLPKTMSGNKILLNVSVTVSDIVGTEIINGNPFPIASSRVYTAPLTVTSGYTVAISGLDAANCSSTESGVPLLGQLPGIGSAFKFKHKNRSRQHLMMLITPVLINGCGVSKCPITQDPWCTPCGHAIPVKGAVTAVPVTKYKNGSSSSTQARKTLHAFGKKDAAVKESAYASATPIKTPVNTLPPSAQSAGARPAGSASAPVALTTPPRAVATPAPSVEKDPQIAKITERVNTLRADLDKTQPTDKAKINEVVAESKSLLSQIEALRGADTSSMTGELGDTWWSVIKLKTDATKMSRE